MKKILILLVVIIAILSCNVFAANFSDLTSEHWAFKPISDMTEKGILSGYPDGSFKPNQSITRAEFAKILVNTLNLTDDSSNSIQFKDVTTEHWAYNYIKVAGKYLTGYQSGSEYLYMPDSAAVREDVASAMVTAMGLADSEFKLETLNKFSDNEMSSDNLLKNIAIAVENGLMNGNADGTFNPKGNLTRAEVCQLMLNALDTLERIATSTAKEKVISAEEAGAKSQIEGETLDTSVIGGLYYEFFVDYNRPLEEAEVEVKDQTGELVDIVEACVATEYEDDAIENDISSVRIRINFELGKKYTFTVKNVVDKEGNKIEDYSFNIDTIVPINDALVKAQLENQTIEKTDGLYHESFVIYNRPLKEAKVEIKDKNGKSVKVIEGKVASEYEDDAIENDIPSVRIRAKYDKNNEYTITIKDVVDKEGFKIEDYSFKVKTKSK